MVSTCRFVLSVPGESSLSGASAGRDFLTLPCLPGSTQRAAAGHHMTSCFTCASLASVSVFPEEALPGQQQQPAGATFLLCICTGFWGFEEVADMDEGLCCCSQCCADR